MANVDLNSLVRDSVRKLSPYHVENFDCEIKLHANENPFPPSKGLLDPFREDPEKFQLNRYPDPECKGLKTTLARRLQVSPENIAIGNGSDELIQILLQIFCGPDEKIAFPDPTFAMYSIIAEGMGLETVIFPLNGSWDFSAAAFLETIKGHAPKILFFSYPNNPTGNCFSHDEIKIILERFKGIVVLDEAYYDFSRKSFVTDLADHNNLVILRSLSKIGLAGLRVGYCIADRVIIEQINKVRLPYNSNTISQVISKNLLENFSEVQAQIDQIIEERERMVGGLATIEAVTVYRSDANFILFRVEQEANLIFQQLIDKGILIRDLSSHPRLNGCLRVTVGTREENDRFLQQMESLMRSNKLRA